MFGLAQGFGEWFWSMAGHTEWMAGVRLWIFCFVSIVLTDSNGAQSITENYLFMSMFRLLVHFRKFRLQN